MQKNVKNLGFSVIMFSQLFLASQLATASPTSSVIPLGVPQNILPEATQSIPLNKLLNGARYNITCRIDNPHEDAVAMRFYIDETFPCIGEKIFLNDNLLITNQGEVHADKNILQVHDVSVDQGSAKSLNLQNLDRDNNVNCVSCFATPVIGKK